MCTGCYWEFLTMGLETLASSIRITRDALGAARREQQPSRWKLARILEAKERLLAQKQRPHTWEDEALQLSCKRLAALYDDLSREGGELECQAKSRNGWGSKYLRQHADCTVPFIP
jgi:hypothetical protein